MQVVVVVVIAQQLFSYHQLSRLRKSATAAGLSHRSCTESCVWWLWQLNRCSRECGATPHSGQTSDMPLVMRANANASPGAVEWYGRTSVFRVSTLLLHWARTGAGRSCMQQYLQGCKCGAAVVHWVLSKGFKAKALNKSTSFTQHSVK